jgi:hypothetical protein
MEIKVEKKLATQTKMVKGQQPKKIDYSRMLVTVG